MQMWRNRMPRFDWHKERWWVKLIAWAMLLVALAYISDSGQRMLLLVRTILR